LYIKILQHLRNQGLLSPSTLPSFLIPKIHSINFTSCVQINDECIETISKICPSIQNLGMFHHFTISISLLHCLCTLTSLPQYITFTPRVVFNLHHPHLKSHIIDPSPPLITLLIHLSPSASLSHSLSHPHIHPHPSLSFLVLTLTLHPSPILPI
jgi:hypothetical protein